jgi:hypothetical protein
MLDRLESLDDQIWNGHSRVFEDVTHVVGGLGIGLLVGAPPSTAKRPLGFALLVVSTILHLYALATAQQRRSRFGR